MMLTQVRMPVVEVVKRRAGLCVLDSRCNSKEEPKILLINGM